MQGFLSTLVNKSSTKEEYAITFMIKNESKTMEKAGKIIGYLSSLLFFSAILYFLLKTLNKLPLHWSYVHIACGIFVITFGVKWLLR